MLAVWMNKSAFSLISLHTIITLIVERFDEQCRYAFIGDYSGQVSVLKLKDDAFDHITTLKGHSGENCTHFNSV